MAKRITSSKPQSPATTLSPLEIELDCATEALCGAEFGMRAAAHLRSILLIIGDLAPAESQSLGEITRAGVRLADDYHGVFDRARETTEKRIAEMRRDLDALQAHAQGGRTHA